MLQRIKTYSNLNCVLFRTYPDSSALSFATWLIYALPTALMMLILSWMFILIYFLRNIRTKSVNQTRHLEQCLIARYEKLGPITFHEVGCLLFCVLIVISWFFRSPGFMGGWQDYFKYENQMVISKFLNSDFRKIYFRLIKRCPSSTHRLKNR